MRLLAVARNISQARPTQPDILQCVHLFSHIGGVHFAMLCNFEGSRVVAHGRVAGICRPQARGAELQCRISSRRGFATRHLCILARTAG